MDLNCDMGESFGAWRKGSDEEILPWVTSISIACGFHAGDALTMRRTARMAIDAGVRVGAHPGLQDLAGFGRRWMAVDPAEVSAITLYQIGALAAIVQGEGGRLSHVKPHGALYHMGANDASIAMAIVKAVIAFDASLELYAPPDSQLARYGREEGLTVMIEAFADRRYRGDGTLVPRDQPNAVVVDPDEAASIARNLITLGRIRTVDGGELSLKPDTICIHADTPNAAIIAGRIRALADNGR